MDNIDLASFGIFGALTCAVSWGLSVICYKKVTETMHPLTLNLFKIVVTLLMLIPSTYLLEGHFVAPMPLRDVAILAASGIIGTTVADTAFFAGLRYVSASLAAILECAYSPFMIFLSVTFLRERVTPSHGVGAVMVILAVIIVTREQTGEVSSHSLSRRLLGSFLVMAGAMMVAGSAVMAKPVFEKHSLLWAVEVRLFFSFLTCFLWMILRKGTRGDLRVSSIRQISHKWLLFWGIFLGSYLGTILWIAGIKYADASVAAVLNQTSTVWIVIFSALFLRERFSKSKVVGVALAFFGVLLASL